MARWHLTSSEDLHENATNNCKKAGLNYSGLCKSEKYYLRTYEKRVVNTPNFVDIGNGDWICSAGTVICDGQLGEPALRKLYDAFSANGIKSLRKKAIGHYAIAIKQNDTIYAFTDPQGAFKLYYTNNSDGGPWFISNSLYTIASSLPTRTICPIKVIGIALRSSTLGEETFYSNISRLFGSQAIVIDTNNNMSLTEIPDPTDTSSIKGKSIERVVEEVHSEVQRVFKELAKIQSIGLSATGGLDTRTILAALLDQQVKPQLLYGVGNSKITNTKRTDLKIVRQLADGFDLEFYQMDWSGNHPYSEESLEKLFRTYGFKYEVYGSSQSLLSELEGGISPYPTLFLGGFSPGFTNKNIWESSKKYISFDYLIENMMKDVIHSQSFNSTEKYMRFVNDAATTALSHSDVDFKTKENSLDSFVNARLFLYIRSESRILNFFNEFGHYIAPFLMKRLNDLLINMSTGFRQDNKFQLRLIDSLYSETLNYDVFSGTKPMSIDTSNYLAKEPVKYKLEGGLVDLVGKVLPSQAKPRAKRIYRRVKQDPDDELSINEKIREFEGQTVMSNSLVTSYLESPDELTLRDLNRLRYYLCGIESLGYSNLTEP